MRLVSDSDCVSKSEDKNDLLVSHSDNVKS